MKFAKIIEVDGVQVLFYREADHESEHDDREMLHQIVVIDEVQVNVKLRNMTEQVADAKFASLDECTARKLVADVKNVLKDALA